MSHLIYDSASLDTADFEYSVGQCSHAQELLSLAVKHLSMSKLLEAKKACKELLINNPNHPMALQVLGIVSNQMGDTKIAFSMSLLATNIGGTMSSEPFRKPPHNMGENLNIFASAL